MALIIVYLLVAYVIHYSRCCYHGDWHAHCAHAKKLFDGVAFSGSCVVMMGIYDPAVLVLIGDTTLYLAIAALAGLGYTLRALFPAFGGRRRDDDDSG